VALPAMTCYYLLSLPLAVAAISPGRLVKERRRGRPFILDVHVGLIIAGTTLLIQSVWR
jgi:uncharacterized protein